MSIHEPGNGKCDGSSHPAMHNNFWLFTVRFIISFVWGDIYSVQRIIGC